MKKTETLKLLSIISIAYPRFEIAKLTGEVWHEFLKDIPFAQAELALKKLILESPFPPSIHDLRKRIAEINTPAGERIDANEAWGEVMSAIRNHGIYSPNESMEALSSKTRQVVKWMGWREICMSEDISVVRGQFLKMYNQLMERDKKERLLPENIKSAVNCVRQDLNPAANKIKKISS